MARDCMCRACVQACKRCPGKFAPGEAEKAAQLLNVSFSDFQKKLVINFLHSYETDALFYEPIKTWYYDNDRELTVVPNSYTNRQGTCIFLTPDDS